MAAPRCDDESDYGTDDELEVSNVHLGLADGPLEAEDEENPLVSRIGGRPAWLPLRAENVPPASLVECAACKQPMQLLVQIFAPLEDSPYDRNLLVWGCAHAACQRKAQGSVRVVRMLKHNDRWAAKLEKQRQRREAREARIAEQKKKEADADAERARRELSSNPFSMSGKGMTPSLFGSGSLFDTKPADAPAPQKEEQKEEVQENDEDDDEDDYDEDERLAEELAIKASLEEQRAQLGADKDWARTAARYTPALYLNTIPEPARNVEAAEQPSKATLARAQETGADMDEGDEEEYEQMTVEGMDTIFERFTARLGSEARQVVRYEYDGAPLPFSGAGSVYKKLWPNGQYTAQSVPPCEKCGAPRVFEVQLMPNLANLLRADRLEGLGERAGGDSEAQRRAEIASTLGLPMDADASQMPTGIVWSTVFVFVCSKDCTPSPAEGWAEEWAGVQFEGEL